MFHDRDAESIKRHNVTQQKVLGSVEQVDWERRVFVEAKQCADCRQEVLKVTKVVVKYGAAGKQHAEVLHDVAGTLKDVLVGLVHSLLHNLQVLGDVVNKAIEPLYVSL